MAVVGAGAEVVLGGEVAASVEVEVGASAATVTAAVTNEESATVSAESVPPPQPARSSITSETTVLCTQGIVPHLRMTPLLKPQKDQLRHRNKHCAQQVRLKAPTSTLMGFWVNSQLLPFVRFTRDSYLLNV